MKSGSVVLATLVATTLAVPAAARAATVNWLVGPITLGSGQIAKVLIGDPTFSASVGVQILAGRTGGQGALPLNMVVNTFEDPNIVPGSSDLVHARVQITGGVTDAQLRQVPVWFVITDSRGSTAAVLPGVAQP